MRIGFAIAACLLVTLPAQAQMAAPAPGAYSGFLQDRTNQAVAESYLNPFARRDTDAQRQARLEKAIALRAEAQQLLVADGGTMTRQHQAYVRSKANRILRD